MTGRLLWNMLKVKRMFRRQKKSATEFVAIHRDLWSGPEFQAFWNSGGAIWAKTPAEYEAWLIGVLELSRKEMTLTPQFVSEVYECACRARRSAGTS